MVLSAFRYPVDTLAIPPKFIFEITFDGFDKVFRTNFAAVSAQQRDRDHAERRHDDPHRDAGRLRARSGFSAAADAFLLLVLVAKMLPAIALAVPIYIVGNLLHQLDTYQVLIAVNIAFNLPFAIWMIRGFLIDLPDNMIEAARVDGASEWQILTTDRRADRPRRHSGDRGLHLRRLLERVSVRPDPDQRSRDHRARRAAELPLLLRRRVGRDQRRRLHGVAAGDRLRLHHAAIPGRRPDHGRGEVSVHRAIGLEMNTHKARPSLCPKPRGVQRRPRESRDGSSGGSLTPRGRETPARPPSPSPDRIRHAVLDSGFRRNDEPGFVGERSPSRRAASSGRYAPPPHCPAGALASSIAAQRFRSSSSTSGKP